MKKAILIISKLIGILLFVFILYLLAIFVFGTITDFQPESEITLTPRKESSLKVIEDNTLSIITWNIGYGGLGAESDFFFDDGGFYTSGDKMVRSPKEYVQRYINGISGFLAEREADFYLLQEVDVDSKRSFYQNQIKLYEEQLPSYSSHFAVNYDVKRVPIPFLEPWRSYGKVESGLGTLSRYHAAKSTRFQLPGKMDWPDYIFQLDRCLSVHEFDVKGDKKLLLINLHNSAYDKGGFMKKQQMNFLKELVLKAYQKGQYIIVGGDWNQSPPGLEMNSKQPSKDQISIESDFLPSTWKWGFDANVSTNRKMNDVYQKGRTPESIIDFFLVSPNVDILSVNGISEDFAYSDHQPVRIEVELREEL